MGKDSFFDYDKPTPPWPANEWSGMLLHVADELGMEGEQRTKYLKRTQTDTDQLPSELLAEADERRVKEGSKATKAINQ